MYIGKKVKACENVGIDAQHIRLAKTATQSQVRLNIYMYKINTKTELSSSLLSNLGYIIHCLCFMCPCPTSSCRFRVWLRHSCISSMISVSSKRVVFVRRVHMDNYPFTPSLQMQPAWY